MSNIQTDCEYNHYKREPVRPILRIDRRGSHQIGECYGSANCTNKIPTQTSQLSRRGHWGGKIWRMPQAGTRDLRVCASVWILFSVQPSARFGDAREHPKDPASGVGTPLGLLSSSCKSKRSRPGPFSILARTSYKACSRSHICGASSRTNSRSGVTTSS